MGKVFQFTWEVAFMERIQDLIRSFPFLKIVFSFFTMLGESVTLVLVIVFLYWNIDKKLGRRLVIDIAMANVTNGMIKNVFRRIRPYGANEQIECLKIPDRRYDAYDMNKQGYSFPSGHATCTASFLSALFIDKQNKKLLKWGITIVFMVALSRVALGVHYPTDVIFGIILGILPTILVQWLNKKIEKKRFYLLLIAYSCLGFFFCESNDYYSIVGILIGFIAGDLYDDRYVNFENTMSIPRMIIRTIVGGIIFLLVSTIMKLPFGKEVLEAQNYFAYCYRALRYALSCFVSIGLYPMLFRYDIFKFEEKDADKVK